MNKNILKQISILSIIFGAALGIITLIPFIGEIAFWVLMCLAAVCVLFFMIKHDLLCLSTVQEGVVLGAISGFVSFIGFSITYIPFVIILAKIFQIYHNYGVSMALSTASFGLIIVLVIFMGILCATINAFSGFLTYYGIELHKMLNQKNEDEQFKLK